MKKISLATLLSLVVSLSIFAQTKKEKIEELFTINTQTSNRMMDGFDKAFDRTIANMQKNKKKTNTDSVSKPLTGNTLQPVDVQPFEDTATYNKMQRARVEYKRIMMDMINNMKKQAVPLYDSAFTEAQIDRQLTYQKSSAYKKITTSSGDLMSKGSLEETFKDTSYKSYVFNPKRKEKLDTLVSLMMTKDMLKTIAKSIPALASNTIPTQIKDTAERNKMQHIFDSTMKKFSNDSSFATTMQEIFKKVSLRVEVRYDKTLTDAELDYLVAYHRDPETKIVQQKITELSMIAMQKVLPKMMSEMTALFKMAK